MTVDSITVKELTQGKIYTYITSVPSQSEKTQHVFVYDKNTKDITPVDHVTVPAVIKQVYFEKETTKYNEVVIKSNDITLVTKQIPDLPIVLKEIDTVYGQLLSENVKTVKVVEHKTTTEYKITTVINGKTNEVVVVKEGPKIEVCGIEQVKPAVIRPEGG